MRHPVQLVIDNNLLTPTPAALPADTQQLVVMIVLLSLLLLLLYYYSGSRMDNKRPEVALIVDNGL